MKLRTLHEKRLYEVLAYGPKRYMYRKLKSVGIKVNWNSFTLVYEYYGKEWAIEQIIILRVLRAKENRARVSNASD